MKATLDEYKEIAKKTKELYFTLQDLFPLCKNIPKSISGKTLLKIQNDIIHFRSDIEERMFRDHPELKDDDKSLEIFFSWKK